MKLRYGNPIGLALLCLALTFVFTPDARAAGLGVTLGLTTGSYSPDPDDYSGPDPTFSEHKGSVGLMFDTGLVKDTLFNYRLGIAYEKIKVESSPVDRYEGVVVENDFGFGYSTETLRLWAGPEIRVNYNSHSLLGVGIGPVVGINVDLGDGLVLCLKGAYVFSRHESVFAQDYEKSGSFSLGVAMKLGSERHPQQSTSPTGSP